MSDYIQVVSGSATLDAAELDTEKSSIWVRLFRDGGKCESVSPEDWEFFGLDRNRVGELQHAAIRYTPPDGGIPMYCDLAITLTSSAKKKAANPSHLGNGDPFDAYTPTRAERTVVSVNVIPEIGGVYSTDGSSIFHIGDDIRRMGKWKVYYVEPGKDPVELDDSQWTIMTEIPTIPCVCGVDILARVNGKPYTCTRTCTFANVAGEQHIAVFPATLPIAMLGMDYSASIDIDASDVYTTSLTGRLPNGLSLVGNLISGVPTETGDFSFSVKAELADGMSSSANFTMSVKASAEGEAPLIFTTALPKGVVGGYYEHRLNYSGSEPIKWSTSGLPAGLSITETGAVFGYPTASFDGSFAVTAKNAYGDATVAISLTIEQSKAAPVITTTGLPEGSQGVSYRIDLNATGDEPINWSATGLPVSLAIDTVSGTIHGIPGQIGTFVVTVRATNAAGTAEAVFPLTIRDKAHSAPQITTTELPKAEVGTPYAVELKATGPEPKSWYATNLPGGLSISLGTGIISGTPLVGGDFAVVLTAKNTYGEDTKMLDLEVSGGSEGLLIIPHKTEYAYGERITANDVDIFWNGNKLRFGDVALIYEEHTPGTQSVVVGYNSDPYKLEPIVTGTFIVTFAASQNRR